MEGVIVCKKGVMIRKWSTEMLRWLDSICNSVLLTGISVGSSVAIVGFIVGASVAIVSAIVGSTVTIVGINVFVQVASTHRKKK